MAAFLPDTTVWEVRELLTRETLAGQCDSGDSSGYSTSGSAVGMAMGGDSTDGNGRSAPTKAIMSAASTAVQKEYLRRMGSRSLTEEQSRVSTHSDDSITSFDGGRNRSSLPGRISPVHKELENAMARHGSDPHLDDRYYASLLEMGNFVKMGWLTKQGHVWKNWKNRFFVLFHDGTLAYYKAKGKRRMKGCMKLNEGVVSIQHVDIRRSNKPYVLQIEKGFYRMWCCCTSQLEAEVWVNALRSVRERLPPCFEPLLTLEEEKAGCLAVNRNLNKVFVIDERIQSSLSAFKATIVPHTVALVYDFIERLEDTIMNRYLGALYTDPEIQQLAGNELVKLLRRHVEDRAFIPVAVEMYSTLNSQVKSSRSHIAKSLKALKTKSQRDFGIPGEIADLSSDWIRTVVIVNAIDTMSLPSYKIDMIICAASSIESWITLHHGSQMEMSDEILSSIFRFVLSKSTIEDLAELHALLSPIYSQHPACQSHHGAITAFLDAIAWIEAYHQATDDAGSASHAVSLASSRVVVSISTPDIGILFTTDGNGRGGIVHSVRKLSQAALSELIVPGLSLIAINDEPVILMPFSVICHRLRTAALPKKLTFLPEFFYYQLLSLDSDMYQYLLCLGASRGDKDSVAWLVGSQLDVNEPCSWERTRGAQLFGCHLPDVGNLALHAAARNGFPVMVEYLLRLGATPSLTDRQGRTALHVLSTTTLDMVSIIQELNDAGASLDATDRDGVTPLMEMARHGSLEGVTTLLALGANLSAIAWSTGYTALEYAVTAGAISVVELLLSKHANPNHATLDGDTSLHLAAVHTDADMVRLLLDAHADPNQQNRFSQTPAAVLLAQGAGRPTSVKSCLAMLADAGCEIGKPDLLGRQLMHLAQLSNDDDICESLRQLLRPGDSVDHDQVVDLFGCTADDYSFDNRIGSDLSRLHVRDPRHMWISAISSTIAQVRTRSHTGGQLVRASSKSFDELLYSLVHNVSVDLADLVAFTMFLESFASLDAVISHLREYVSNGSKGRNLLRFVVVLLLFKLRQTKENDGILTEIYSLLDRHRRLMSHKAAVLIDDYKTMFERLFSLCGSPNGAAEYYASVPVTMQKHYGLDRPQGFSAVFPRNLFIQVEPSEWAEHCTLVTHTLFCSIPVEDFVSSSSKCVPSRQYLSAKRWFQHLTAYVINAVLVEDTRDGRAHVIEFFLTAADCCLSLRNYDTLAAILYALQSTAVQRLRRTLDSLSVDSKKLLNQMQGLSDKGCREVNKIMHAAANPSMPYIGLYLQGFVGLHELPVFEKGNLVNGNRLRKMGELVVEILRRRSVAYELPFRKDVDLLLHVQLPYATDESRYTRSLQLEPREAGAAPLGDRMTVVDNCGDDIDSEVRESIGSEGTFGIRQWFRMQKVVHRHRSRSATQPAAYEWV